MPEYLSPGVYIEEFEIGARPIEGVSTSTAGFLGEAERGTTRPTLVTSWLDYQRRFGSYFGEEKYLPYAVLGFFENGGQRCFIGRIVKTGKAGAKIANLNLTKDGNNALTVKTIGEGNWGNHISLQVLPGTESSSFKLKIFYKEEILEEIDNISVDETLPDYYDKKVNEVSNFIKLSRENGDSGNMPEFTPTDTAQNQIKKGTTDKIILNKNSSPKNDVYKGMRIKIIDGIGKGQENKKIIKFDGTSKEATIDTAWDINPDGTSKYCLYWVLEDGSDLLGDTGTAQTGGASDITLENNASDEDNFYKDMLIEITGGTESPQSRMIVNYNGKTRIATVDRKWEKVPGSTSVYHIVPKMDLSDYMGNDKPDERTGIAGFAENDEISIVYSPNSQDVPGLVESLISHCEILKDRFAIIDSPESVKDIDMSKVKNDARDTKYAALYYPWIEIIKPDSGALLTIPPGGHIAGIYARSDTERGVHKAPANESVRSVKKLEFPITKGEQDILNPRGVNVIRAFPDGKILVWGARTLSTNSLWKYINVRRLFIYIEKSIEKATQWVVFEPNSEKLWARVRATITEFLTRVWKDGALMGTKPEEAFFVKCDRTTMTQDDIDNGRLICIIGIAPVKPAEFVIFRLAQWHGGSAFTE